MTLLSAVGAARVHDSSSCDFPMLLLCGLILSLSVGEHGRTIQRECRVRSVHYCGR